MKSYILTHFVHGAVYLPNGKSYTLKYDSYGELARVVLPTGGAIEYDWGAGDYSTESDGGVVPTGHYLDYGVYRRVIERRVYADGSTLELKETYERPTEINGGEKTSVVMESRDASNNLLTKQKSYFWGSAKASFQIKGLDYSKWRDGREYQTEAYHQNSYTVLRTVENTFAQRASVSWWTGSSGDEPANDPRLTETKTSLVDETPNLITKKIPGSDLRFVRFWSAKYVCPDIEYSEFGKKGACRDRGQLRSQPAKRQRQADESLLERFGDRIYRL